MHRRKLPAFLIVKQCLCQEAERDGLIKACLAEDNGQGKKAEFPLMYAIPTDPLTPSFLTASLLDGNIGRSSEEFLFKLLKSGQIMNA